MMAGLEVNRVIITGRNRVYPVVEYIVGRRSKKGLDSTVPKTHGWISLKIEPLHEEKQ